MKKITSQEIKPCLSRIEHMWTIDQCNRGISRLPIELKRVYTIQAIK